MPTTPTLGLPYPVASDSADVPRDMEALAEAVDAQPGIAPVGCVMLWATATPPAGWLLCQGQLVSAAAYPKLAVVLGQSAGNVTIPDLRDRVPVGSSASKALGSTGGEATHLLTAAESGVPSHNHQGVSGIPSKTLDHSHDLSSGNFGTAGPQVGTSGDQTWVMGSGGAGTGRALAALDTSAGFFYGIGVGLVDNLTSLSHTHTIPAQTATNAATAHNNLPPYLSVNYIIRAA